jgi:hypothetical protein
MSESTVGPLIRYGPQQITYGHSADLGGSALEGPRHFIACDDLGGTATESVIGWCHRSINQFLQQPAKLVNILILTLQAQRGLMDRVTGSVSLLFVE